MESVAGLAPPPQAALRPASLRARSQLPFRYSAIDAIRESVPVKMVGVDVCCPPAKRPRLAASAAAAGRGCVQRDGARGAEEAGNEVRGRARTLRSDAPGGGPRR